MKKKGFTLIELLAVIVILAIIALIAVPSVLNIIEDSKKSAAEASARSIVSAAKTYTMQSTMNGTSVDSIDLSGTTLKYDGEQATKGYVIFDKDGKATSKMYVNGYCVEVAANGDVTSEKTEEDECDITVETTPVTYTKYNDGTPLLYDPVNNVKCTESEVETNVNNYTNMGDDVIMGLKDGCMKWYAFLDSESSSTIKLILDHNTTGYVKWNSDENGTTPDTVNAKLATDITNWNAEVKATARLISAEEVNQIAPTAVEYEWIVNDMNTKYYLHTGNQTEYKGAAGTNKYAWLFDHTEFCVEYGGYNDIPTVQGGYWTSTFISSKSAWAVQNYGNLEEYGIIYDDVIGIRPVIEVDKTVFAQ